MLVSDFWDGQAATFDDEPDHGLRDPAVRAAWARTLLPLLPDPPAAIADLGAGTGSLSLLLARAGYRVSGLDIAPAMVTTARAKVAAAAVVAEVSFEVGDAAEPPWAPGIFDVVLCRHVLWALPDPHAAVGAWLRLLVPGGRLLMVEGRWHTGAGLTREQVLAILRDHRRGASVTSLDDPDLWGGPTSDDRYLVVSEA